MMTEKVVIKTNNIKYGPMPAFNDEVEQHVKIHRNGRIQITRYVFGSGVRKHGYVKAAKNAYQIPAEKAAELLDLIGEYFTEHDEEEQWLMKDAGDFRITITMEDGTKIRRYGSLGCDFQIGNDDLDSIIRKTIGIDDLFLFNGHYGQRYIYLRVKFPESDREYFYQTTDESIDAGDMVLVPAGPNDHKEIVTVVRKEELYEDELPMPPEKVKKVISKTAPAEELRYSEDLTDRQVYDTPIGPVCMSKREYQDYQDLRAMQQPDQEKNEKSNT
jgi:hypothetical protein